MYNQNIFIDLFPLSHCLAAFQEPPLHRDRPKRTRGEISWQLAANTVRGDNRESCLIRPTGVEYHFRPGVRLRPVKVYDVSWTADDDKPRGTFVACSRARTSVGRCRCRRTGRFRFPTGQRVPGKSKNTLEVKRRTFDYDAYIFVVM